MMVSVEQIAEKMQSLGYSKEGIYDISFHRLVVQGSEVFCLFIKEHDFSFGVRYTITAQAVSADAEHAGEDAKLMETEEGRATVCRRIISTVCAPYPAATDHRKTVKVRLNWLEPDCIYSGIEQIEKRLIEAVRTALITTEECQ